MLEGRRPLQLSNQSCAKCILGALTFSVTPRSVIVFAGCAATGNAAAIGSAATVFMSIDLFISLPSRVALTGAQCPPPPTASDVPVLVVD
jgi:hypothetical protein